MNEQHVLVLHVAEVLGHGERGQADAQPHPGRLVHLAVDERRLVDDARLLHLQPQVGALTGALAHAGEDRDTTVLLGHPVDHLLDEDGLAHTGPTEEADLAALHVRLEEVDHLDPGLEHLGPWLELVEGRCAAVDLPESSTPSTASVSSGWPSTLKTWPSTALPTGTVIPRPRLRTAVPRTRPSVCCMQMQRTRPSPICWATSAVTV